MRESLKIFDVAKEEGCGRDSKLICIDTCTATVGDEVMILYIVNTGIKFQERHNLKRTRAVYEQLAK